MKYIKLFEQFIDDNTITGEQTATTTKESFLRSLNKENNFLDSFGKPIYILAESEEKNISDKIKLHLDIYNFIIKNLNNTEGIETKLTIDSTDMYIVIYTPYWIGAVTSLEMEE
jgi:hypothetical protein